MKHGFLLEELFCQLSVQRRFKSSMPFSMCVHLYRFSLHQEEFKELNSTQLKVEIQPRVDPGLISRDESITV